MQRLADGLTAARVDALLRKWLARLPHPFAARDRQRGIRYDVSILQAEFARTEVLDRPAQGRVFFEEVLRENLDMGRPDHVQLIFDRRVHRRTLRGIVSSLACSPGSAATMCPAMHAGVEQLMLPQPIVSWL